MPKRIETETAVPEETPSLRLERLAKIGDLVSVQGAVRVSDLSSLFQVSEVTIRNDLDFMARNGILVRDRGGAVAHPGTALSIAFEKRAIEGRAAKRAIGRAAAALVRPGQAIMMDAGTTLMEMARTLPDLLPLTIVTHATNLAIQVASSPNVQVIVAGGTLSRENIATVGPLAERDLAEMVVDTAFLGAHAFHALYGVTDVSLEIARVKQAMCSAAREVILLADSSKWGRFRFARVAPLTSFHRLITDPAFPAEDRRRLEDLGLSVTIAGIHEME